jgi:hypothetical protein
MKIRLILSLIALAIIATSCETETPVTVNLTWEDSEYYELNDGWKASIYLEPINFLDAEDYDLEPIETKDVSVNDDLLVFNVSFSSYENFTVVIFNDLNNSGSYDEGENASVKFEMLEAGVDFAFDITVSY